MLEDNQDMLLYVFTVALLIVFIGIVMYSKRRNIKESMNSMLSGMLERDTSDELDLRLSMGSSSSSRHLSAPSAAAAGQQRSRARPVYLPSFVDTGDEGGDDQEQYFVDGIDHEIVEDKTNAHKSTSDFKERHYDEEEVKSSFTEETARKS